MLTIMAMVKKNYCKNNGKAMIKVLFIATVNVNHDLQRRIIMIIWILFLFILKRKSKNYKQFRLEGKLI